MICPKVPWGWIASISLGRECLPSRSPYCTKRWFELDSELERQVRSSDSDSILEEYAVSAVLDF